MSVRIDGKRKGNGTSSAYTVKYVCAALLVTQVVFLLYSSGVVGRTLFARSLVNGPENIFRNRQVPHAIFRKLTCFIGHLHDRDHSVLIRTSVTGVMIILPWRLSSLSNISLHSHSASWRSRCCGVILFGSLWNRLCGASAVKEWPHQNQNISWHVFSACASRSI